MPASDDLFSQNQNCANGGIGAGLSERFSRFRQCDAHEPFMLLFGDHRTNIRRGPVRATAFQERQCARELFCLAKLSLQTYLERTPKIMATKTEEKSGADKVTAA